jgi:flagellar protein FlaJ
MTAYGLLKGHLPTIPQYKDTYEQSGIPLIYEAYLSTGLLVGLALIIPSFALSFLIESRIFPSEHIALGLLGSAVLSMVVFATTILVWLTYPILRRNNFKSALEGQLAYSFGILGVLAAAGMTLDRLFEKIASSESNPVLAELARRFLRNVRLFGMDSESALREVAAHSPSQVFAGMLDSIAVAYRTTGSVHDLVMFESSRLLQDKRDNLRRTIGSLSVLAELYITLVVVGPIIFIVMLAIFGLLPTGGLPNPIFLINLIVFIGIPILSIVFIVILDSAVGRS